MPLIIPKSSIEAWTDPKTSMSLINQMMKPYSNELMTAHTISTDAGNSRINRNIPEIKNRVDVIGALF